MPNVISPLSHIILETIHYAYFLYIELRSYLLVIYQGVSFSCPVPTSDYFSLEYKIKYLIVFAQNVLNGLFCFIFIISWKKMFMPPTSLDTQFQSQIFKLNLKFLEL